jgi:hypothetical protein
MADNAELARLWFLKADDDFSTCKLIVASGGSSDAACFHAQQTVEIHERPACASGARIPANSQSNPVAEVRRDECRRLAALAGFDFTELNTYAETRKLGDRKLGGGNSGKLGDVHDK